MDKMKERLKSLTVPELKEILRSNGQKSSGKKDELIARITEDIPAENYIEHLKPQESAYEENQKMKYGFTDDEIAKVEKKYGANTDAILEELLINGITKYTLTQDYGLLRNNYLNFSRYFKKRNRIEEYLRSLLSVIYYDLSGVGNNNSIENYAAMDYVFETSLWEEIDKARTALKFTDADLMILFDEAIKTTVKPPFSYFDTSTMKKIILDKLRGETNLLQKYESFKRSPTKIEYAPPKSSSKNYKIWLTVAAVFMCVTLCIMFIGKDIDPPKASQFVPVPLHSNRNYEDTPQLVAANPIVQRDALQNLFEKISVNTTGSELESLIANAGLEYTKDSTAPKQVYYKIGYKKSDTYFTRSTGGDYLQVSFDNKGKFLHMEYYNSKLRTELYMSIAPIRGQKNDGRTDGYYYIRDLENYQSFEDSTPCYGATDALSRLQLLKR